MKTFFCILFCFLSVAVFGNTIENTYKAEGMGVTLLEATMHLTLSENEYTIQTHSYTKGILSLFISPETIFKTQGKINQNQLDVIDSMMQNKSGKKIETIRTRLNDKPSYLDYQSVLIELMRSENAQDKTFYLTDGKRDMRATLTYEGNIDLSTVYSKMNGTADAYAVRIEVISGKKKGWFFKHMQESVTSPLRLYLQKDPVTNQKTLVLGTFDTGIFGILYIVRQETKE